MNTYFNSIKQYATGNLYIISRDDASDNSSFRIHLSHRKYAKNICSNKLYIATQVFYYDVMSRETADKKPNHQSA